MLSERYPAAAWMPGLASKVGYSQWGTRTPKRGIVPHSAEGWASNIMPILLDANRRASWPFTITLSGNTWQHYDVTANCWHAGDIDDDGGVRANIDLVGIEFEGVAGTPINDKQVTAMAALYRWLQLEHGFGPYVLWRTVYEHRWVSDSPTACPSGRIRHNDIIAKIGVEERKIVAAQIVLVRGPMGGTVWLTDWLWKRPILRSTEIAQLQYLGIMGPVTVPQALIDPLRIISAP